MLLFNLCGPSVHRANYRYYSNVLVKLLGNLFVVTSVEREVEKTKKTDGRVMTIRMMMTRNIVEEHGKVIVMMIESLIGEKKEVNMILKGVGTERDMEGEDMEVRIMGMMMKKLMVGGKEENIDLKEEDGIHLQMTRDMTNTAPKKDWREMMHRTATKE